MSNEKAKKLARQLRNVGPKLAQRLIDSGIETPAALRKLGAQEAFLKMYQTGDAYGDYNAAYLYALEGAIQDCDWLGIGDDLKTKHQKFAHALQAQKKPSQ
ncbi:TfoX/Sxy family DNA transformation protein [Marinicella litoralis]|nr:TfoX/Sxy family DNA transformation protein [Marinicella litoralis]